MSRGAQSRGQCAFCGYITTKGSMPRHLAACPQRHAQISSAGQTNRKPETLYHLRMQDAYDSNFWLDLEVRGSATLKDIDTYLRAIWLECCGHLSQFSVGGWRGPEIAKSRRVDAIFQRDIELTHIYDFGTSFGNQDQANRSAHWRAVERATNAADGSQRYAGASMYRMWAAGRLSVHGMPDRA
jgi:hypothetical protein